jgi:hypothetical protein
LQKSDPDPVKNHPDRQHCFQAKEARSKIKKLKDATFWQAFRLTTLLILITNNTLMNSSAFIYPLLCRYYSACETVMPASDNSITAIDKIYIKIKTEH